MAILDVYLDIPDNYVKSIQDIYKMIVVLGVVQLLIYYSKPSKDFFLQAFTQIPMNDHFMTLIIYFMIGIISYYLVAEKILMFY